MARRERRSRGKCERLSVRIAFQTFLAKHYNFRLAFLYDHRVLPCVIVPYTIRNLYTPCVHPAEEYLGVYRFSKVASRMRL